jgi:hypothetical protein
MGIFIPETSTDLTAIEILERRYSTETLQEKRGK